MNDKCQSAVGEGECNKYAELPWLQLNYANFEGFLETVIILCNIQEFLNLNYGDNEPSLIIF